jgi:hypothetical protein
MEHSHSRILDVLLSRFWGNDGDTKMITFANVNLQCTYMGGGYRTSLHFAS